MDGMGSDPDERIGQGEPRRMINELRTLESLSRDLIHTLGKCSLPHGFRQCTGSQIHKLIQQILAVSRRTKEAESDLNRHQEMKKSIIYERCCQSLTA
jgi:hypothetical protein